MKKVLFVCTGNICRSPSAEAVFRKMAAAAGKDVAAESAGTGNWHSGLPPDRRAVAACAKRGYSADGIRARQVCAADFAECDIIYAMTAEHRADLAALAPDAEAADKIRLFMADARPAAAPDVPDPYYGGDSGFETMLELLEEGCRAIIARLP